MPKYKNCTFDNRTRPRSTLGHTQKGIEEFAFHNRIEVENMLEPKEKENKRSPEWQNVSNTTIRIIL